jgi:hypothetical protein
MPFRCCDVARHVSKHYRLLLIGIAFLLCMPAAADDRVITLADGRQIILHDDFTWEYYAPPQNEIDTTLQQDNQIPASKEGFKGWFGGGYTFRFNDHFCINPWAAVHIPIGGDRDVHLTNETFKIRATPLSRSE